MFGLDFKGKRSLKEAIGQAIIDRMVDRTQSGQGIRFSKDGKGVPLKLKSPYSKTYADSDDFKAFGKSRSNVNMTLTGDMLASIDIKSIGENEITIGITETEERAKAFNHQTGDTVPSRPFFGVSKKELGDIKRQFGSDIKDALKTRDEEGRQAFEQAVLGLIDRIQGDGEG